LLAEACPLDQIDRVEQVIKKAALPVIASFILGDLSA